LRKEQDKVIPKDKYDEARNKSYPRKTYLSIFAQTPSLISSRLMIFYSTFVGLVLLFLLFIGITNGANIGQIILLTFLSTLASPFFLLIFPSGLGTFIIPNSIIAGIVGYISYIVICLLGIFVKDSRAFIFIYLIFITFLIMNVIGCNRIVHDFSF